jgi:hypothetical protein
LLFPWTKVWCECIVLAKITIRGHGDAVKAAWLTKVSNWLGSYGNSGVTNIILISINIYWLRSEYFKTSCWVLCSNFADSYVCHVYPCWIGKVLCVWYCGNFL